MSFTDERQMNTRIDNPVALPSLGRILLYVREIEVVAKFYVRHFGYEIQREEGDRIVELASPNGSGANIMLHPIGQGRKQGQTLAKLLFDVPNVAGFVEVALNNGLEFGAIYKAAGYEFSNAKDPAGNSISVSSRIFRREDSRPD